MSFGTFKIRNDTNQLCDEIWTFFYNLERIKEY